MLGALIIVFDSSFPFAEGERRLSRRGFLFQRAPSIVKPTFKVT